jgi:Zn-dependent protease with chaperone function
MTSRLRTTLAVCFLAGCYVLGWLLILGYLAASYVIVRLMFSPDVRLLHPFLVVGVVACVPAAFALIRVLLMPSSPSGHERAEAVPLTNASHPQLWATVTDLADALGTRPPDEICLAMEANAAFAEEPGEGRRPTTSARMYMYAEPASPPTTTRLYIGLPLVGVLRTDEFRAVLCHELAHGARRHGRFSARVHRGAAALHGARQSIAAYGSASPTHLMYTSVYSAALGIFASLTDNLLHSVMRRQELEADAAAAAVVGREALSDALTATELLPVAWEDFRRRFLDPAGNAGSRPDDAARAFGLMMGDADYRRALERWRRARPTPWVPPHRATHPSLRQRLAALRRCPDAEAPRDASPARELFGAVLPHATTGACPWREWVDQAAEIEVAAALEDLEKVVRRVLGITQPSATIRLEHVMDLIESGRGGLLKLSLQDADWGERQWGDSGTDRLSVALDFLLGQALVRAGRARWRVTWAGPARLVTLDDTAAEACALAQHAVSEPKAVARLRRHLPHCGIDSERSLDELASPPGPSPEAPDDASIARVARSLAPNHRVGYGALALAGFVIVAAFSWQYLTAGYQPSHTPPAADRTWSPSNPLGPDSLDDDPYLPDPLPYNPPTLPDFPTRIPALDLGSAVVPCEMVIVEPGDTLSALALRHGTTMEDLTEDNALSGTDIHAGQELRICGT